jgi:dTDP-4-dehydrorhamnose reductase
MRVLITGSNGLLGTKLLELLLAEPGVQPLAASRHRCSNRYLGPFPFWQADLAESTEVKRLFAEARPDVVLHTAAMTDVDGCEREPDLAWRQNVDATSNVARAAADGGARMVHLSTEYVFDGTSGPYRENEPVRPIGFYGRTKLVSEQVVLDLLPNSAVARTTIVFGHAPNVRPNFVTWLLTRLQSGEQCRVVCDQIGSPTLADSLARMVWSLGCTPSVGGVFNTVGDTVVSRYDFARLAASVFELNPDLVVPIETASLGQTSPRPLQAGLRMEKFRALFPEVPVLSAEEALLNLRAQMAWVAGGSGVSGGLLATAGVG